MKLFDSGKITSNDEVRNYFSIFSPALLCLSSVTTSRFHCNLLVIELKLARQMLDNDEQFCIDKYQKLQQRRMWKAGGNFSYGFAWLSQCECIPCDIKEDCKLWVCFICHFFIGIIKIAHTKLQLLRKDSAYWKRLIFFSVLIKKVFIAVHKINKNPPKVKNLWGV